MQRNISTPDYYANQRKIADTYGVNDNLAGCHVCHYPDSDLCGRCKKVKICQGIYEQEKAAGSDIYD